MKQIRILLIQKQQKMQEKKYDDTIITHKWERFMKWCFFSLGIGIFIIIFCTRCGKETSNNYNWEDVQIGIIETNGNEKNSEIKFYNKELKEISQLPIEDATLGNIFHNPIVYQDFLYVIPQGYAYSKDEKKVLEVNLKNLEKKEYKIDQLAMNSICVNNEFIYTCNTLNGDSYINQCNKKNEKVRSKKIKSIYISKLVCDESNIYAFGTSLERSKVRSYIFLYDQNLKLKDKIDITEYGICHYKAILNDKYLIFSNAENSENKPNDLVTIFSIENKTFENIKLNKNYPLDLGIYKNYLIISHYDLARLSEGGVSIYNLETKEHKYFELSHGVEQMSLLNSYIYILGDQDIYQYKIDNGKIKLENTVDIRMKNKENYLSGIFVVK